MISDTGKSLLALSLLAWGGLLGGAVIDVRAFGAKGDGVTDDSAAIRAATDELHKQRGGELFFPAGTYRFARAARGAVVLQELSNCAITFAPGAELLMDNLRQDGRGGGHGIVVRGPASDIALSGVRVRWRRKASARSSGDGFRFEGFPADGKTLERLRLRDCRAENSPQTGAVFMGCSDIFVTNFQPVNTWADGLHFNACRRVNVNGVRGVGNGDDTLAFVTYYAPEFTGRTGGVFSFPQLNEWSNSDSCAVNISSVGGNANGMRISGGLNINVANIAVSGKWCGIQLDSARKTENSRAVGWGYPASRNINIANAAIRDCEMGFIVRSLNIPPDAPESDWRFRLDVTNLQLSGIRNLALDIQSVAGVSLRGVRADGASRIRNARGRIAIDGFDLRDGALTVAGIQGKQFSGYESNMEPKTVEAASPGEVADGNLRLAGLNFENAPLTLRGIAGLRISDAVFTDSPVKISVCRDIVFAGSVFSAKPLPENSRNIRIDQ